MSLSSLHPLIQGENEAVTTPDRRFGTADRDSPVCQSPQSSRSLQPCPQLPAPAHWQPLPHAGGSTRPDPTGMNMVKSPGQLEQRLAGMVAVQETSPAWSALGEEGPVCVLFLFFNAALLRGSGESRGGRRGERSGAGGNRGKWREVPERESREARHRKRAGGACPSPPALPNEHICEIGAFLTELPTQQLLSSQD